MNAINQQGAGFASWQTVKALKGAGNVWDASRSPDKISDGHDRFGV